MAITPQAAVQIVSQSSLYVPSMAAQPVLKALQNTNYLWQHHTPALVDVCPNAPTYSRRTIVIPIIPSVDGIRYALETRLMPSATSTVNITVSYCDAYAGAATVWHVIFAAAGVVTAASTLLTHIPAAAAIPATAVALQWDVTPAAGTVFLHHCLAYPAPGPPISGITASGFVPFDDGILNGLAGAPVHTEFLNRCKLSTLKILQDRYQMAFSFVQAEAGVPQTSLAGPSGFVPLPPFRVYMPNCGPTATLHVRVLADVIASTTPNLVLVAPVDGYGSWVTHAADGAIHAQDLPVLVAGKGTGAHVDLKIGASAAAGNSTRIRAVVGFWRPTE